MSERCSEDCFWVDDELENCPISQKCCCLECEIDCEKRCHTSSQIFKNPMNVLGLYDRGEIDVIIQTYGDGCCEDRERQEKYKSEILRLARLGQQRQWIPVSEMLPQEKHIVLIWTGSTAVRACIGTNPYGKCKAWYLVDEHYYLNLYTITHWMPLPPLPEPPKEGGE